MRKWLYRFTFSLTSALVGSEWGVSRTGILNPGEEISCTHWIASCVGNRAGLDDVEKR
jgi:hypothetical protein